MINIRRDNTVKKEWYYAVTDKGVIYGGSKDIVERKIKRKGAGEVKYDSKYTNIKGREIEEEEELPF